MYHIRQDQFSRNVQILSELSAWNDHVCSPDVRRAWLCRSGGVLRAEERMALCAFASAMQHGPADAWGVLLSAPPSERHTFLKQSRWRLVSNALSEALNILKPRCRLINKQSELSLTIVKQRLEQTRSSTKRAIVSLHRFLDLPLKRQAIKLNLLLPKVRGYEAWAHGVNSIILMPPHRGMWDNVLRSLLHEHGHLLFRTAAILRRQLGRAVLRACRTNQNELKRLATEVGLPIDGVVEELFLSSLVPEGKLGTILFPAARPWRLSKRPFPFERRRLAIASRLRAAVVRRWQGDWTIEKYWEQFTKELPHIF